MNNEKPEMVLYKDAAKKVQEFKSSGGKLIEIWETVNGYLLFDEDAARYKGCTHRACEDCGKPAEKAYTQCKACRDIESKKKFLNLPEKVWDNKTPLYSRDADEYFFDFDDLYDDMMYDNMTWDEMGLVICKPDRLLTVSEDSLIPCPIREDYELPNEVLGALQSLNTAIREADAASWYPGNIRALEPVKD